MATMLLCYYLLCFALHCLAESTGSKPPKIVTKGGNLVLQAGDNGNIVFEPDEGKQVFIGSSALNISGSAAVKGEKGDTGVQGSPGKAGINGSQGAPGQNGTNGVKGDKGEPGPPGKYVNGSGNPGSKGEPGIKGVKGLKGEPGVAGVKGQKGAQGIQGPSGNNGTVGPQGPPGPFGTKGMVGDKGEPGSAGPPGPSFNTMNQSSLSCENATEYGLVKFMDGYLQVCTKDGWNKLSYLMDVCQDLDNYQKMMYEAFQTSTFGLLLQFNGNLKVNLSPRMNATNITAGFFTDYNDNYSLQEIDTVTYFNLLRTLEMQSERSVLYGFYSNDIIADADNYKVDYDRWHLVTWTWTKVNKRRRIFVNFGKAVKDEVSPVSYQGISGKTQIGTWWSGHNGLTTNIKIDTLYIINKALDFYTQNLNSNEKQLCYAKAISYQMP